MAAILGKHLKVLWNDGFSMKTGRGGTGVRAEKGANLFRM